MSNLVLTCLILTRPLFTLPHQPDFNLFSLTRFSFTLPHQSSLSCLLPYPTNQPCFIFPTQTTTEQAGLPSPNHRAEPHGPLHRGHAPTHHHHCTEPNPPDSYTEDTPHTTPHHHTSTEPTPPRITTPASSRRPPFTTTAPASRPRTTIAAPSRRLPHHHHTSTEPPITPTPSRRTTIAAPSRRPPHHFILGLRDCVFCS